MQIDKYCVQGRKGHKEEEQETRTCVKAQKYAETLPPRKLCRLGVRRKAKGQTGKMAKPMPRGLSVLHSGACVSSTLYLRVEPMEDLKQGSDISRLNF